MHKLTHSHTHICVAKIREKEAMKLRDCKGVEKLEAFQGEKGRGDMIYLYNNFKNDNRNIKISATR